MEHHKNHRNVVVSAICICLLPDNSTDAKVIN